MMGERVETLDGVLADIEAMGWRVDEIGRRVGDGFPQDWRVVVSRDGDEGELEYWEYGDTRLGAAVALRNSLRRTP